MKKTLSFIVACLLMVASYGCVGGNTPKGVVKKAMECLQNNDYKGYVDLIYLNGEETLDAAGIQKKREQIAVLLEGRTKEWLEGKKGIVSYKIDEEIVDDDEAKVKVRVVYGDGSDMVSNVELVKDMNGKWRLDVGK